MGGIVKGIKKVVKGVGKVVKKVAKGIKKVASGIWSGIKKVGSGIMKAVGKLGPIGSLALSFVLPGIGSAIGSWWTTTATNLGMQGGFLGAVGQGMQFVSNTISAVKSFAGGITDKIGSVFKKVGGTIQEGASNLWNSAKEFVGLEPAKASSVDVGKFVGEGATKAYETSSSAATTAPESIADFATKVPETVGGSSPVAPSIPSLPPTAPNILTEGSTSTLSVDQYGNLTNSQMSPVDPSIAQPSVSDMFNEAAGTPVPNGQMSPVDPSLNPNTPLQEAQIKAQMPKDGSALTSASSSNLLSRLGSSLMKGFGPQEGQQGPGYQFTPYTSGGVDPLMQSLRGGLGGSGASGGQFLDQAQLAQQEAMRKQLEQLG